MSAPYSLESDNNSNSNSNCNYLPFHSSSAAGNMASWSTTPCNYIESSSAAAISGNNKQSSTNQQQHMCLVDILEREFCDSSSLCNNYYTNKIPTNRDLLDPRLLMDLEPTPIREPRCLKTSHRRPDAEYQALVEECHASFFPTTNNNSNNNSASPNMAMMGTMNPIASSSNPGYLQNAAVVALPPADVYTETSCASSSSSTTTSGSHDSARSSHHNSKDNDNNNDTPITTPARFDVVCSRGREFHKHPGCIRYRELVKQYQDEYRSSTRRVDKAVVIEMLVDRVREEGLPPARFLKFNRATQTFQVMDEKTIRDKVGHALRAN